MTDWPQDLRVHMTEPLGFDGPRARCIRRGSGTVWFEGFVRGRGAETVAEEALRQTEESVAAWLDGLDGFFRIAVRGHGIGFAACDPIRGYPLIWARDASGAAVVSASGPALERALSLGPDDLDPDAVLPVTLSGFTVGAQTIYRGVRQIGPGRYLWIGADSAAIRRYHLWDAWNPATGVEPAELATLHERLIDDLVRDANGRQILVPLSAGYDSRFIASGLRAAGYANVLTVAYGLAGNREAETSRKIARRLGYPWEFVPYANRTLAAMFHSSGHRAFTALSDSLTSAPFTSEYHALDTLMRRSAIGPETMVVNGQSGDFITGNHLQPGLFEPPEDPQARRDVILDALLAKHFRQWESLRTPDRMDRITAKLQREIDALGVWPVGPEGSHGLYEFIEFQDRQSKHVVNGQRLYEHFGLDWRLPLWDRSCLDWWARAPLAAKMRQSLYREVLRRTDWAGVWRDIPVNPTRIRPAWIRPLRLAAKAAHAPLGRAAWHRFEKRYFDYWMDATRAYAAWPYGRVCGDRRGHYSAVAWHIESYLNGKGLAWDGTPLNETAA